MLETENIKNKNKYKKPVLLKELQTSAIVIKLQKR